MKKIKEMILSAPTKKDARITLEQWLLYGTINAQQYLRGKELIRKEFNNPGFGK